MEKENTLDASKPKSKQLELTGNTSTSKIAHKMFTEGMRAGFELAIKELKGVSNRDDNGGITRCLHSVEWAAYLEQIKSNVLQDSLE